jgi:hypothetical protein
MLLSERRSNLRDSSLVILEVSSLIIIYPDIHALRKIHEKINV